jgi:hypothetical protein
VREDDIATGVTRRIAWRSPNRDPRTGRYAEVVLRVGSIVIRVDWKRHPADADYVILEDPEGNRFCVVDASERPAPTPATEIGHGAQRR